MSVRDAAKDWLTSKLFPWPTPSPPVNKIDTHHHWVPPAYAKAVEDAGGDPSGWPTPKWSLDGAKSLMNHVGCATAILSITAPGACIVKGPAAHEFARQLNVQAAEIRDAAPHRFGFFTTLANVLETEAALKEIAYSFDVLKADGVCLFTRYGNGNYYLGHPDIEPIWAELNKRKAVVFIHPTHPVDTDKVNDQMPQPWIDYPHETTRTAVDMLVRGTVKKHPNCKIILSHAGGTLPYLISRVATPLSIVNPLISRAVAGLSYDAIMDGYRSFYYDLALSASPTVLEALLKTVPHDHILYGSDFPYAPPTAYPAFSKELEGYNLSPEMRDKINFGNAVKLFPRLANKSSM